MEVLLRMLLLEEEENWRALSCLGGEVYVTQEGKRNI